MRDMIWQRVRITLTALFVALLGATGAAVVATPAQAAFGGNCATNSICLYQWTGFGAQVAGDRWQSSFNNIISQGGCLNVYSAYWDNGTAINNNSGSLMYVVSSGYANYAIRVYDWENCNASGPSRGIGYAANNTTYPMDNLATTRST